MKTKILMAAIVSGLMITAVGAQAQGRAEKPDFATLDADGDGAVTMTEIEAQANARFTTADTDGDGALSVEELAAQAQTNAAERAAQMLSRLDENEDGVLQVEEMRPRDGKMLERMFSRLDADNDGSVSEEEFDAAKDRFSRHEERDGKRGGRGGHGHRDGHRDRG